MRTILNKLQTHFARPYLTSKAMTKGISVFCMCLLGVDLQSQDASDLAKQTQNPVSDLISVPFQYNANFDVGPNDDLQSVLNIQPVIPFSLNDDWNLISRTIIPVIDQPSLAPGLDEEFGIGDINFSFFLSPKESGSIIWGLGPILSLPTATHDVLGTGKVGVGPSAVALTMKGPWVFGALANNVWSIAGEGGRQTVNQLLVQPFVNYNLPKGWYLVSGPVLTANWEADSDDRWTVPIGGGFGKIFKIGNLPVNSTLQAYGNVVRPSSGATWQLRFQVQLLFPKN
ncbi:neuromedin U [bacterium]|nr:neuromedin U [bacterium]